MAMKAAKLGPLNLQRSLGPIPVDIENGAQAISRLVGRDQELADVMARLDAVRLLTLTGVRRLRKDTPHRSRSPEPPCQNTQTESGKWSSGDCETRRWSPRNSGRS